MANQSLEILFWLILVIYISAKFTQTKIGHKQQY